VSLFRSAFLAASQNPWLREHAPRMGFVRRTASRFLPGERLDDALAAATRLQQQGIGSLLTHLGENITSAGEAAAVAEQYSDALARIRAAGLPMEPSLKLTHLGLDLSPQLCRENLARVIAAAGPDCTVWIDMESSAYVDRTLALYRRALASGQNVGICVQSYLYRTPKDVEELLQLGGAIRLVKGAYKEPPEVAFPKKRDVDRAFFAISQTMLSDAGRRAGARIAFGTHDLALIRQICDWAAQHGVPRDYEFQMLYGIQPAEQLRLARAGFRSIVLIAYGRHWYSWFMRRMAERPANAWFALKNMIG
jgi:proline dehydrogenase